MMSLPCFTVNLHIQYVTLNDATRCVVTLKIPLHGMKSSKITWSSVSQNSSSVFYRYHNLSKRVILWIARWGRSYSKVCDQNIFTTYRLQLTLLFILSPAFWAWLLLVILFLWKFYFILLCAFFVVLFWIARSAWIVLENFWNVVKSHYDAINIAEYWWMKSYRGPYFVILFPYKILLFACFIENFDDTLILLFHWVHLKASSSLIIERGKIFEIWGTYRN